MNKLKKQLFTIATFVLIMILSLPTVAFSDDLGFDPWNESIDYWDSLPIKENVSQNKTWTIKFKNPINQSKVNDSSIFVLDERNDKVATTLTLSDDHKQVKITPTNGYKPNYPYMLYILDRVEYSGIRKGFCMPFTIDSDALKIDGSFNNQNIILKKGEILQLTLPNEGSDGGYSWTPIKLDKSLIKNTENISIVDSFYPKLVPGVTLRNRWLFEAIETGKTSLKLEYKQPWESNSTIHTFNLNINIQ
ncbi:protease inhibitor I42 family protein [Clostridium aciditolerans]|uniref:Protease inhibitor I42 family protein n=1 Tax=Clostridium aciditolerans TaxID=339861 RepID=A0A934I3W5_9CLOT|nr:protease inhibitor I42 family protein [Clostridium aciditolerans]MBI6875798.1 protease inhibitor I42 family protein [Clostridium aciditolerans]